MKIKKNIGLERLNFFLKKSNFKKIFFITGSNSFYKSGFSRLCIKNINSSYEIYFKKSKLYPEIEELNKIINKINLFKPDLIVAVGGGVVMDYAKLSNLLFSSKNIKKTILEKKKLTKKKSKILLIPTTAGSGSEATCFSVIYINNVKYSLENNLLIPDYFYLIPDFVIKCPKKIRVSAGFDAFAQSLEAFFSLQSNNKSIRYSITSLKYSINNLLPFICRPNIKNAKNMCLASYYSGKAINIAKTNLPHALSYFFSSKFKLVHGQAVSLFFSNIIKFYYYNYFRSRAHFSIKKRFLILFRIFSKFDIDQFCSLLNKIISTSGLLIDRKILDRKIKSNFKEIISSINKDRLNNSPIKLNRSDLYEILFNKI